MSAVEGNQQWASRARRVLLPTYASSPVAMERGLGVHVWDVEGKQYLDFCAGVAVSSTGHSHPLILEALHDQAGRLWHSSNLYTIPRQVELAERLVALSGIDGGCFFANSGAEAMETLLKAARAWGRRRGGGRNRLVATTGAFHGRTLGALSLTGQPRYQEPFSPMVDGVDHVPFGDIDALDAAVDAQTCAVVLEPVQGEAGVVVAPPGYLAAARQVCDDRGALLLLDEVQTGIARTGSWFAFQQEKVMPDGIALAKGLGSGFPIGAAVVSRTASALVAGDHGSTFGGNPLACAVATATLDVIEDERLVDNARGQGQRLSQGLKKLGLRGERGLGLLRAFDTDDAKAHSARLLRAGLLTSVAGASVRLSPPLVVTSANIDQGIGILREHGGFQQEETKADATQAR